jgi:hypothetical protein
MIPVFIPYVNRVDLLDAAIESATGPGREVFVIDNSGKALRHEKYARVLTPSVPLTFAQTQNWMLKISAERFNPFYLFMHSDAEAGEGTVEKLIEMARSRTDKWGAIFTAYDALAAFNVEAMQAIGGWDTFLEWYHSDTDVYRRLRLAGYPTLESNLPVKHTPSSTLNSDPEIAKRVNLMFPCRVAYYRAKWGGDSGSETFTKPWNS